MDATEPKLLPQTASPTASTDTGAQAKAFDMDAFAKELGDTPKEYSSQAPPPNPEPPPPDPKTQEKGPEREAGPEPTSDDGATAEFIVDMYDMGVSKLSEALVDDAKYPAKHFGMEPMLKDKAKEQLAKGMASGGGKWNIPWYVALSIVVIIHGVMTWFAVRQAKKEKRERHEEERAKRQQEEHDRQPDRPAARVVKDQPATVLQDRDGNPVKVAKEPKQLKVYGACEQCGGPLHTPGRRYCGKSCGGKATSAKRRAAKSAAAPAPAPQT